VADNGTVWFTGACMSPNISTSKTIFTPFQVKCINCDNASNNDTMAERLETLHAEAGLDFDAQGARLCCMPHTVHLSALEECF
jgi:hypothetical protein